MDKNTYLCPLFGSKTVYYTDKDTMDRIISPIVVFLI